ncbi:MAG: hypothetical protein Q9221_006222 [Calogaya cf. arnoldii]
MAAPGSVATRPHFSFRYSTGELLKLDFQPGLGRMAVLIRARHELDGPKPKSMEFNILTRIIERFQVAFALKWKIHVPDKEDDYSCDPEKRDEILPRSLDSTTETQVNCTNMEGDLERITSAYERLLGLGIDCQEMKDLVEKLVDTVRKTPDAGHVLMYWKFEQPHDPKRAGW